MNRAVTLLVCLMLLSQDLIDLAPAVQIGPWRADAPVADLLALALLPLAALGWSRDRTEPPGWRAYSAFLIVAAVSVFFAQEPAESLHHLVRKPLFLYLAYGVGLSWAVARVVPRRTLIHAALAYVLLTAGLSLGASALRIAAGEALWFQKLDWITPNHKTLAVALAAWVPFVLGEPWRSAQRGPRLAARIGGAAIILALLASASKTALITAAFGLAWHLPRARPLSTRPRLLVPLLAAALGLAVFSPLLLQSRAMLDAARSRYSLNVRAWEMFSRDPLFGSGTGMNVVTEMVTFPHYRVNGVDAHGVVQKIASETGLMGLLSFGAFTWSTGAALRRRAWRRGGPAGRDWGLWGTWAALHVNLLLSTETFSPTHWVPLGLCWGLSLRAEEEPDA